MGTEDERRGRRLASLAPDKTGVYIRLHSQVEPLGGARRNMVFKDEEEFLKAQRVAIKALFGRLSLADRLTVLTSPYLMAGLTLEELMAGLSPEERRAGLTPEQLLAGLTPAQLRAGFTPEQLLAGLTPEQLLAGLTPEQIEELKRLLH